MKEYNRLISVFEKNCLARTKIDLKTFNKNKSKEWYMDAEEQLKYGVVDEIVDDINSIIE